MEGRGEIPASVGTPNYIDLNDPDIIMPHDDEASVRRFVDDVKVAFVNAERCSAYRFQPDNVRNQTEHVLLLLANIAGRNHQSWADEGDLIVTELADKVFEAYTTWCDKMEIDSTLRFCSPVRDSADPVEQSLRNKLANIALFWCIWGEGANCRHVGELLCYFFFHIVHRDALAREEDAEAADSLPTRPRTMSAPATPATGDRQGRFSGSGSKYLDDCVRPVYNFMAKQKGKKNPKTGVNADHTEKLNFSDMNEFFWSKDCRRRVREQLDRPGEMMAELSRASVMESQRMTEGPGKTIGDVVVEWMEGRGKTFNEHRGLRQILKVHNRVLIFYTVLLYVLIVLAIDMPFEQDEIPSDIWDMGNRSRWKYALEHREMFRCGLPLYDQHAYNIGVDRGVPYTCCRLDLSAANWTARGPEDQGAWQVIYDDRTEDGQGPLQGKCAWFPDGEEMTEWLRDALAMTAVVISGLLWLRTLLFMVTDWGVTRRRFVLFSALFLRTVFTVALVAATWRWSTEDWLVQSLATRYIPSLFPQFRLLDQMTSYYEHWIHFYVGMGYTALYLLEEIVPQVHNVAMKGFSVHAFSPWLKFAGGVATAQTGDIGLRSVAGWLSWVAFLAAKLTFSYYFEIRPQVMHAATLWGATHCYEDLQHNRSVCPSYERDDFNVTHIGVSNRPEWGWLGEVAESPDEIVSDICDFQCDHIINTKPFKWVMIGLLFTPTILVYYLDTQVVFALFQTAIGCFAGASRRVAALQTFDKLRKKFQHHTLGGLFEAKIATYRGNYGEAVDGERGECHYVDADGLSRKSFFPCPRMTTFRSCWDRFMESMRFEDLLSDKELFLFKHPAVVPDPRRAEMQRLANQRVQCFGTLPLFLLAGGVDECIALFERAKVQLQSEGDSGGGRDALMDKCIQDAVTHASIVPSVITAWKNAVRLIEVALQLFAEAENDGPEDRLNQSVELGNDLDTSVAAEDAPSDDAGGATGGGRPCAPNMTRQDVDGPPAIGSWLPAVVFDTWIDDSASEGKPTMSKFALDGNIVKLRRIGCDLVDCLLDGRLAEHPEKEVREGIKKMRRSAGTSQRTSTDQGVHPLLCAARSLQSSIKGLVATIDPVLKACGAEQEEDPAFEAYVSRRRAAEPAEAGAEAEYPPRDQLQDEWRSLDEEQKQPFLEQYGEARRRTTWTEVKDAVEQFCEGGEDTERRVIRVCERLLMDEEGSHSLIVTLFHLLKTTVSDTTPQSEEVVRRMLFWGGTLHMSMPRPPRVDNMLDFTTLVPYYNEEAILSKPALMKKETNGMSIATYLRDIHEDDWKNFEERMQLQANWANDPQMAIEFRLWASNRSQTLARCIRGMMYNEQALQALAEAEGYTPERAERLARQKCCVVFTCQIYGNYKKAYEKAQDDLRRTSAARHGAMGNGNLETDGNISRFHAINEMLRRFPHLRVAYIDNGNPKASVLIRWDERHEAVVEVYRIELPGMAIIGEGKPENQNHAMIFTRGRFLQTVDMNQDGYFEESLKMRNMLEEFQPQNAGCCGFDRKPVTIVGFGEYQFSAAFNAAAEFSALSEFTFTNLVQRSMDVWGDCRMHYGHPDLHDRLWLTTRGGVSKANSVLCINEDIFGSYESMLRGGRVVYREYLQVGKGKDMGFSTVGVFEAKIACGNAEQALSRDMFRINESMGLFRLLSYFHTSNGFFINNILVVWATMWFIYQQLLLALFVPQAQNWAVVSLEKDILFWFQLGMIQTIPLVAEVLLQKGLMGGLRTTLRLVLLGGPIFYLFHVCTRWFYYLLTVDMGGAQYRASGRGFIIEHVTFLNTFQQFGRSHFVLGMELLSVLVVLCILDRTGVFIAATWPAWMFAITCLWAPFLYNFEALEYTAVRNDFAAWWKWMMQGQQVMAGWHAWHSAQTALYRGPRPMLVLRNLMQLFIPLATAFKYFEFFLLEYKGFPINACIFAALVLSCIFQCIISGARKASSIGRDGRESCEVMWNYCLVFSFLCVVGILTGSAFLLKLYSLPATILVTYAVVIGYGLAWFCNTAFYLGARWAWITKLYWLFDITIGLIIFCPLFLVSFLRCFEAIHMRCIFDNKVLSVIERNRMREKSDWSVAPEAADDPRQRRGPINGVNGIPSLRASPRSEGHEPLISPASSPASTPNGSGRSQKTPTKAHLR